MIKIKILCTLTFLLLGSSVLAQSIGVFQFDHSEIASIQHHIDLEDYAIAHKLLQEVSPNTLEDNEIYDYFHALLELKIDRSTNSAKSFISASAGSSRSNLLKLELGSFYFKKREYQQSLAWYRKAKLSNNQHRYQYANVLLAVADQASALNELRKIESGDYFLEAQLMLGKILWDQDEKSDAVHAFEKTLADNRLKGHALPYLINYYYGLQDYPMTIDLIDDLVLSGHDLTQNQLMIKGLCHEKLGETTEAFSTFHEIWLKDGLSMSSELLWSYARTAQQTQHTLEAIQALNHIVQRNDELMQLAAFQLGLLQVQKGDVQNAIASFQLSRQGNDSEINQKSLLNLGKATFELGWYEESIGYLTQFRENYPSQSSSINDLITQAHFLSTNYEVTIDFIESNKQLSPQMRRIYQIVTYENGRRYYIDQKIEESILNLEKSLRFPVEKSTLLNTRMLLAESYALTNDYKRAIPLFLQIISSSQKDHHMVQALYGLGYAYYNSQEYDNALNTFQRLNALSETPINILTEVDVRIADCLFMAKEYQQAISYYNRLKKSSFRLHVLYQIGQLYVLTDKSDKAINSLKTIVESDSVNEYTSPAAFLIGQIYLDQSNYTLAVQAFDIVISQSNDGELRYEAMLEKSLAATNMGDFPLAASALKTIIYESDNRNLANNALLGLQNLQSKGYKVDDFDHYFEKIAKDQSQSEQLIMIAYEAARTPYFQQLYAEAIQKLNDLINRYGQQAPADAHYYLGDAYFRTSAWQKAIASFDTYLEGSSTQYRNRILDKKAQAQQELGLFDKALLTYQNWQNNAANNREIYQSNMGMLKTLIQLQQYQQALTILKKLEQSPWKPINADKTLSMLASEIYEKLDDTESATDELLKLMNNAEGEAAAIAHYRLASIQSADSNYNLSNETLFNLIGDFSSYPEWTNKAYLLLIDNYTDMGNMAQGLATAQSIIENSHDSVFVEQAKVRQEIIQNAMMLNSADSTVNKR
jgi:tetratricopeptide (TPR) repeat protein